MDSPPPPSPGFVFPLTVTYRDQSGPFAIDATVTVCQVELASGHASSIRLTIGSGTLHDADKGAFPLDGLQLAMRVASDRFEPLEVINPGALSEFQQEGLLDAVSSYLNDVLPPPVAFGDRP